LYLQAAPVLKLTVMLAFGNASSTASWPWFFRDNKKSGRHYVYRFFVFTSSCLPIGRFSRYHDLNHSPARKRHRDPAQAEQRHGHGFRNRIGCFPAAVGGVSGHDAQIRRVSAFSGGKGKPGRPIPIPGMITACPPKNWAS